MVVAPSATAIHTDADMMILQNLRKGIRGELTSLVRIEYGRCVIACNGFLQSFFAES